MPVSQLPITWEVIGGFYCFRVIRNPRFSRKMLRTVIGHVERVCDTGRNTFSLSVSRPFGSFTFSINTCFRHRIRLSRDLPNRVNSAEAIAPTECLMCVRGTTPDISTKNYASPVVRNRRTDILFPLSTGIPLLRADTDTYSKRIKMFLVCV